MSKRGRSMPLNAVPVSLFGEAACSFADAHGFDVATHSLKGGRSMSTADARAFLARGPELGADLSSAIWIVLAHEVLS